MDSFEEQLARGTDGSIVGAVALVVNKNGNTLYFHSAGRQSLDPASGLLSVDSTVTLASAGKFLTHVAALQLVEQGRLGLDDPVDRHVPEIATSAGRHGLSDAAAAAAAH